MFSFTATNQIGIGLGHLKVEHLTVNKRNLGPPTPQKNIHFLVKIIHIFYVYLKNCPGIQVNFLVLRKY